jgi:hypothetical protein
LQGKNLTNRSDGADRKIANAELKHRHNKKLSDHAACGSGGAIKKPVWSARDPSRQQAAFVETAR